MRTSAATDKEPCDVTAQWGQDLIGTEKSESNHQFVALDQWILQQLALRLDRLDRCAQFIAAPWLSWSKGEKEGQNKETGSSLLKTFTRCIQMYNWEETAITGGTVKKQPLFGSKVIFRCSVELKI